MYCRVIYILPLRVSIVLQSVMTEPSDMIAQTNAVLIVWMSYRVTKRLDIVMMDVTQGLPTVTAIHVRLHIDVLIYHINTFCISFSHLNSILAVNNKTI